MTARRRRIGVFGGTFDPPHRAHLAVARAALAQADCDEVVLVVAGDPWQKTGGRPVTPAADRLAMLELLVDDEPGLVVSDVEVRRDGPTYTIDTLEALAAPDVDLVLILGADAAAGVPTWHRAADVVAAAEFAVIDRPGVAGDVAVPGARVMRVHMAPDEVSSTTVRALAAAGADIERFVGPAVAGYLRRSGLYAGTAATTVAAMTAPEPTQTDPAVSDPRAVALAAARAMDDKKGTDVVVMDVSATFGVCDYFVVCSASNARLVRTIVDHVDDVLRTHDLRPRSREGLTEATWCLLDYGDVVVHVFDEELRSFYNLERLWSDAPRVEWAPGGGDGTAVSDAPSR